jgi:hypothetical protein
LALVSSRTFWNSPACDGSAVELALEVVVVDDDEDDSSDDDEHPLATSEMVATAAIAVSTRVVIIIPAFYRSIAVDVVVDLVQDEHAANATLAVTLVSQSHPSCAQRRTVTEPARAGCVRIRVAIGVHVAVSPRYRAERAAL